jgi:hypothetical protein
MSYYNTIDTHGFLAGGVLASLVSDLNRDQVVEDAIPETTLGFLERWRWVLGQWVAAVDYRGHSWYNPTNTNQVHNASTFDDAPPEGWVYWVPGENRVTSSEQRTETQWVLVRSIRDRLLGESDWTDTASAPARLGAMHGVWQSYRQALRDISTQANPFLIQWPTKPGAYVVHDDIQDEYLGQEII